MRSGPAVGLLQSGALALACLLGGTSASSQDRQAPVEPVLRVTVLRAGGAKSLGLDAQLAAFQPTCGRLLVGTNAALGAAGEFQLRFSWRAAKDAHSSNDAPSLIAGDAGAARRALLAAMADSYPEAAMNRVGTEALPGGTGQCCEVVFPAPHSGASLARQFRTARRLVAAQLAALHMGAPAPGTWPPGFRPGRMLALYDAEGVGYYGSTLLARAVEETTLDARTVAVCPEDLREGILDRCAGVLFPGGSGKAIAVALHPDGVRRVRDFVARGGGYFGVCAGAYFAASGLPEYAGMVPLRHDQPWAKGKGTVRIALTPEGAALLGGEFGHFETGYHCGPVFPDLAPDGRRAPVTVLANFESPSTDAKGVIRREMIGTPAILSMEWQKGRILIVSPHPEAQAKTRLLVARAIAWTLREDPRAVQRRPASAAL